MQASKTRTYETCGKDCCDGRFEFTSKNKACAVCPGGAKASVHCLSFVLECLLRNGEVVDIKFLGTCTPCLWRETAVVSVSLRLARKRCSERLAEKRGT